jgi:heme exporter protein D
MPWIKRWGNRVVSRLISRLAGQTFHDVSSGMRCYSRKAALQLHLLARFTYTQEVVLNLAFKQLRIVEVPIRVRGEREFGESRVASNLWRYGARIAQIIFRSYRDYHPLRFFGGIALALLVPAVALSGFLLWHYLETGGFSPHKWAGFSALGLVGLAVLMFHMGVIGDMLTRHRVYLEELLSRQRSEARRRQE